MHQFKKKHTKNTFIINTLKNPWPNDAKKHLFFL